MRIIIGICLIVTLFNCTAYAMGGQPPKEKPKYKLEIMKMNVITAPAKTKEASKVMKSEGKETKYQLEIMNMDVITSPTPSPEAKAPKP